MVFPTDYTSIEAFEELNMVCICICEIDEGGKLRLSKSGKIEYLTLGWVYLLRIESEDILLFIKNFSHLFNLSTQTGDQDKRFWHICLQKAPVKEYNAHICKRYNFAKESTCTKLPEEDTCMKFNNLKTQKHGRATIHSICRH